MRNLISGIALLLFISVYTSGCSDLFKKNGSIDAFSWLEGHWVDSTNSFYESWVISDIERMQGKGYQIADSDTIFGESLSIENDGRRWNYVVTFGDENTVFRLVNKPGDSLVFENPDNEFPKRITYLNKGNKRMSAIIENPGEPEKFTRFNFIKAK